MSEDLFWLSASELARDLAARRVSATEVVSALLARIDETNSGLNAICTLTAESALAAAGECDRRLQAGTPPRALEGVPFLAKDNLATKGVRTTYGALPFAGNVPAEDVICVERLKASGAILLGKTNTPEFAHDVNTTNRLFGTTRNPWDPNVTAGGSSGGTGSAVAAGMAPLGLGTDLGGSIRIPASFCGLVGLRTVPGRVPVYPADFAWDTLVEHVHGPITRTVADAALMLSVMAGVDDRAPNSLPDQPFDYMRAASGQVPLKGRRIAYSPDLGGVAPVDPEVVELTRAAARQFEALGCQLDEICPDLSDIRTIVAGTRAFGMIGRYADYLESSREQMTEQLVRQVTDALQVDARTITRAERVRTAYYHRLRLFMQTYDYMLCPTVGAPAFRLDRPLPTELGGKPVERFYDVFLFTYAFSVTGLPAISVPCGFTRAGLPVGLQIVGRRLREDAVLEAAAAYLQACPQHLRRPGLDADSLRNLAEVQTSVTGGSDWIGRPGSGR
jgi:amidase